MVTDYSEFATHSASVYAILHDVSHSMVHEQTTQEQCQQKGPLATVELTVTPKLM